MEHNRDAYTESKGEFIKNILRLQRKIWKKDINLSIDFFKFLVYNLHEINIKEFLWQNITCIDERTV